MQISQIYQKFNIPPKLQEHMLTVTSIGIYILENWKKPLNKDPLLETLLLHDIGNIVKFDFNLFPELLQDKGIEYWRNVQQEVIAKYGREDHLATQKMLKELGVEESIYNMSYWNIEQILNGSDDYLKIALYSDLRVGPFGIIPLQERIDDVHTRLQKYNNRPELKNLAFKLEKQIQEHCTIFLDKINVLTITPTSELLSTEINSIFH